MHSQAQGPNPGSPKLHSLPDNSLNPLGLLAEASLANRRAQAASRTESRATANTDDQPKLGVASDVYFKPGMYLCMPPVRTVHLTVGRAHDDPAAAETLHREANTARDVELRQYRGGRRTVQDLFR